MSPKAFFTQLKFFFYDKNGKIKSEKDFEKQFATQVFWFVKMKP